MDSNWIPLPRSEEGPRYIIKYRFESSGYTIFISDASRIWTESLDQAKIVERARTEDCSITPSDDDPNQLSILFEKLENAFYARAGAAFVIDDSKSAEKIWITTSSPLPSPLPPLNWTFDLRIGPAEAMRKELVVPLLSLSYAQTNRIEELSTELYEKDNAISQLLDKVQTKNLELKSIFPNVPIARTSKKDISRADIGQHLKAYRPFEKDKWLKAMSLSEEVAYDSLVLGAFRTASSFNITVQGFYDEDTEDRKKRQLLRTQSTMDEFQKQPTPPPRLQLHASTLSTLLTDAVNTSKSLATDDTTDDSDDLDAPARPTVSQRKDRTSSMETRTNSAERFTHSQTPNPLPFKKLGRVGSSKPIRSAETTTLELATAAPATSPLDLPSIQAARPKSPSSSPSRHTILPSPDPSPRKINRSGSLRTSSTPLATRPSSQSTSRRIGKIGGSRSQPLSPPSTSPLEPSSREPSEVPVTPRKRIGKIGGRGASQASQGGSQAPCSPTRATQKQTRSMARIEEEGAGLQDVKQEEVVGEEAALSLRRESSQDRADRKREELKRELEEKGKAGAKRKRRF